MKSFLLGIISVLSFFKTGYTQNYTFQKLDSFAIHTPQYVDNNIDGLVKYCHTVATSPKEQARFYFVWVASHIHYDTSQIGKPCLQDFNATFNDKKAICRGYTELFQHLCSESGIKSQSVIGYAKDINGHVDTTYLHAWNVVKINQKWSLFDVTWASNHFESVQAVDDDFDAYFNQSSFEFLKRHLPFDPIWQLRNDVLTFAAFTSDAVYQSEKDMPTTPFFKDFNKIIEDEEALDKIEKSLKGTERALEFNPSEKRLYGIFNYFKSEKAALAFYKANRMLEKLKKIDEEVLRKWTYQDVSILLTDAQDAYKWLSDALSIYESMTYVCENEDTRLIQSNMISIKKNKELTLNLIEYLKEVKTELGRIPLAKVNR